MEEFQASLTPLEKQLCSHMEMVMMVGKMRRSVPVLLTSEVVAAMNLLVKYRSAINIPEQNPFLFARPYGGSLGHLQAWDCLHVTKIYYNDKKAFIVIAFIHSRPRYDYYHIMITIMRFKHSHIPQSNKNYL